MILKSHRKAKNLVEPNNFEKANKRKKNQKIKHKVGRLIYQISRQNSFFQLMILEQLFIWKKNKLLSLPQITHKN